MHTPSVKHHVTPPGFTLSLVARLKLGHADAFDELTHRYRLRIVRHAMRYLREPADAEDLAQEVLVKVWRHVACVDGDELLWPWMARVTTNAAISWLRVSRRDARVVAVETAMEGRAPERPDPPDRGALADQQASCAQFRVQATAALARLPSVYRGAVQLVDFREYSVREASLSLGVPVPTVKSRAIRGRRLLRQALGAFQSGVHLRTT